MDFGADGDGDVTMTGVSPAEDCLVSPFVAPDIQSDATSEPIPSRSQFKYHIKVYPGAAQTYGKGPVFMDKFNGDQCATMREENLYYPWASCTEWEIALFLLCSSLSMAAIDKFLSLELVSPLIRLLILRNCCF